MEQSVRIEPTGQVTREHSCPRCGSAMNRIRGRNRCKPCLRRADRVYYATSENRRRKMRESYVLRRYGTTMLELEALFERQDRACAICTTHWTACVPAKRPTHEAHFLQRLCVDHCHRSGQVRGLLCNACNTALGLLQEEPARFLSAVSYLDREPAAPVRADLSIAGSTKADATERIFNRF